MIRQLIPEEYCLKCKGCCRFAQSESMWSPNLLDDDAASLLKYKIPPFFIQSNKKIRVNWSQEEENFVCSLLNPQDNKCRAYGFRPFECQLYPFLISRTGKKTFLAVDEKCPFVKEKQKSQFFKAYIQYLTDALSSPELRKTLKQNLHIVQEYPDVINLVALKI